MTVAHTTDRCLVIAQKLLLMDQCSSLADRYVFITSHRSLPVMLGDRCSYDGSMLNHYLRALSHRSVVTTRWPMITHYFKSVAASLSLSITNDESLSMLPVHWSMLIDRGSDNLSMLTRWLRISTHWQMFTVRWPLLAHYRKAIAACCSITNHWSHEQCTLTIA